MNALIQIGGQDVTKNCLLDRTHLEYDSTRIITTAQITVLAPAPQRVARYDTARYDQDRYGIDVHELMPVVILDGRDGVTKLFAGQIYKIERVQTDSPGLPLLNVCTLLDYAAWLDRAVCLNTPALVFPCTDQNIIQRLVNAYSPNIDTSNVWALMNLQIYDYIGKTCRQVLDDLAKFSNAEWRVDFDGKLFYNHVADAPAAPFNLSTAPDNVSTFPVRIDSFARDFTNPVNNCIATGKIDPSTGVAPSATYSDPTSVQQYGQYDFAIIDDQITNATDAQMRAQTTVLKYAFPIEQGTFTIWKDGLKLGQKVNISDTQLGIDGTYIIRSLALTWRDQSLVEYKASFGAAQPQLEAYLRLIDQLQRWRSQKASAGIPTPGSVGDAQIAPGGLSASSINSVNATTIQGQIAASQIGSVNAGVIQGQLTAGQIGAVNAATIQGQVVAGQIGSVSATTIQGVVVSSQLADGIIDTLSKYSAALTPIAYLSAAPTLPNKNNPPNSYYYLTSNGHFYQVNSAGSAAADAGTDPDALAGAMKFYNIGAINAKDITGLILAAQINSITAGQITGAIQAAQIAGVNASTIIGTVSASQIASVNATAIVGLIQAGQINSINANQIATTIQGSQITAINAATITIGLVGANQISSVNASQLNVGGVSAQTITVYDSGGTNVIGRIGQMTGGAYGEWSKVWGAGGTDYTTAIAYTDTGGNLYLKQANLTITGGGSTLTTGPATFDSTYSSLVLKNYDASAETDFVSRGLVFYAGGSKIGSLVKSPGGSYLELEFTIGGGYTLINGSIGVRSDAGYRVGSNIGKSGTFTTADSKTITVTGGIITNIA